MAKTQKTHRRYREDLTEMPDWLKKNHRHPNALIHLFTAEVH